MRRRGPVIAGATALITGASSGIGLAIARLMAPQAGCLVLVARRRERLEALQRELITAHPKLIVRIECRDLSSADEVAALVAAVLRDGGIDILVNNAGLGNFALLRNADWAALARLLQTNVLAVAQLTHGLLPSMRARGRGGILMIGSGAGLTWLPGAAVYVGSKHFIDGFSESLRLELQRDGPTLTQVCPGPVTTEFDEVADLERTKAGRVSAWLRIDAEQCAREAMQGFARGAALVLPGWRYRMLMRLQAVTPRFAQRLALRSVPDLQRQPTPPLDRSGVR